MNGKRREPTQEDRSDRPSVPSRLADDSLYRALSSARRRRLLSFLCSNEESTVEELAGVLAGWDAVSRGAMATPEDHEAVATALVHSDLPLLVDAGLVRYDPAAGTIRPEPLEGPVRDLIRRSVAAEQPEP